MRKVTLPRTVLTLLKEEEEAVVQEAQARVTKAASSVVKKAISLENVLMLTHKMTEAVEEAVAEVAQA